MHQKPCLGCLSVGVVAQFCLSIKSHILDSNGVLYCSFWSEGSINPLNFGPGFCPQGPWMAAPHGILIDNAVVPWIRGPCATVSGTTGLSFEIPCGAAIQGLWGHLPDQIFQRSGVYRPLQPKRAIPHPITIQNMSFYLFRGSTFGSRGKDH